VELTRCATDSETEDRRGSCHIRTPNALTPQQTDQSWMELNSPGCWLMKHQAQAGRVQQSPTKTTTGVEDVCGLCLRHTQSGQPLAHLAHDLGELRADGASEALEDEGGDPGWKPPSLTAATRPGDPVRNIIQRQAATAPPLRDGIGTLDGSPWRLSRPSTSAPPGTGASAPLRQKLVQTLGGEGGVCMRASTRCRRPSNPHRAPARRTLFREQAISV
jgi:hypothetical protein